MASLSFSLFLCSPKQGKIPIIGPVRAASLSDSSLSKRDTCTGGDLSLQGTFSNPAHVATTVKGRRAHPSGPRFLNRDEKGWGGCQVRAEEPFSPKEFFFKIW